MPVLHFLFPLGSFSIRGISIKILDVLARSDKLSAKDLAELLGISYNLAKLYVYNLRKYGLIVISSYENYYYYSLTEQGRALLEEKKQLLEKSISSINS
ncbi:MAG: winged helix-turn-helix transcriptional regulator, partial [Acidilobaceae archaeon]